MSKGKVQPLWRTQPDKISMGQRPHLVWVDVRTTRRPAGPTATVYSKQHNVFPHRASRAFRRVHNRWRHWNAEGTIKRMGLVCGPTRPTRSCIVLLPCVCFTPARARPCVRACEKSVDGLGRGVYSAAVGCTSRRSTGITRACVKDVRPCFAHRRRNRIQWVPVTRQ